MFNGLRGFSINCNLTKPNNMTFREMLDSYFNIAELRNSFPYNYFQKHKAANIWQIARMK